MGTISKPMQKYTNSNRDSGAIEQQIYNPKKKIVKTQKITNLILGYICWELSIPISYPSTKNSNSTTIISSQTSNISDNFNKQSENISNSKKRVMSQ